MTDSQLRQLERQAQTGDQDAAKRLCVLRCRNGDCCLHENGMSRYAGASALSLQTPPDAKCDPGGLVCCWCGRKTHLARTERSHHGSHIPPSIAADFPPRGGYHIP